MKKFDRNTPYNDLPDLPPSDLIFDKDILLKWGIASRALAELNRNIMRMPNPTMLVNTITLQEAQTSTAIENIFTTDDELYKAVSDTVREDSSNLATKEVLRYREALWKGYNTIKENDKLDQTTIIKVFQQIKNTRQSIRPPQSQVVIKRGQSDIKPGEIIYTPPRGQGIIENKIKNLIEFLNDHKKYPIDPLLKMVVAHYQFEAIHPFTDGNGRTGRILNLLYLVQQQLLSHPVLFLSKYILNHKDDYYANLAGVTTRKAWKPWLNYMLTAVELTSIETNQIIDEILSQMDATHKHAKQKLKWYSVELNQLLFSQPYIKPKVIGELLNVRSRTTLTKYMQELTQLSILSSHQEGKEVFYLNNDLIRILKP
jgi:Fic family protein